jgi:hypothetical protein
VDALLIDGMDYATWGSWIEEIQLLERPKMILWFETAHRIEQEKEGPFCKDVRNSSIKVVLRL